MIVRRPRYNRFTVLPNDAVTNETLSWKARGLLAFLLSKPDHWRTTSSNLANMAPDGTSSFESYGMNNADEIIALLANIFAVRFYDEYTIQDDPELQKQFGWIDEDAR